MMMELGVECVATDVLENCPNTEGRLGRKRLKKERRK